MDLYHIILIPIAFGLLGFVEPCSIGANIIFLGYLESRKTRRIFEAIKFTITRALFLGLIGLAVGAVGQTLRLGAYSYSLFLGVLYLGLGILGMFWRYQGQGFGSLDVGRYFPREGAVPLGMIFGMSAPACSLPLFLGLVGLGAVKGASIGFLSLFLFGLGLSAPLVWIAASSKAEKVLRRLGRIASRVSYLPEAVLVLVGSVTILIAWYQIANA